MKKATFALFLILFASFLLIAEERDLDIEPSAGAVVVNGNIVYMTWVGGGCNGKRVVAVVDVSKPKRPRLLQTFPCGHFPQALFLDAEKRALYMVNGVSLFVFRVEKDGKISLLQRYPYRKNDNDGPVDVTGINGEIYTACRAGGVRVGVKQRAVDNLAVYSRAVFLPKRGHDLYAVTTDGLKANYGLSIVIPVGTPRRAREFSDGKLYIANGFSGIAICDGKDLYYTKDLNRHSSYGSFVYDVLPLKTEKDGKVQSALLAAGEIGLVVANVSDPKAGITFPQDVENLRWGDVRGFAMGQRGLLYVNDYSHGLRVVDVSNPAAIQVVGSLCLTSL